MDARRIRKISLAHSPTFAWPVSIEQKKKPAESSARLCWRAVLSNRALCGTGYIQMYH